MLRHGFFSLKSEANLNKNSTSVEEQKTKKQQTNKQSKLGFSGHADLRLILSFQWTIKKYTEVKCVFFFPACHLTKLSYEASKKKKRKKNY